MIGCARNEFGEMRVRGAMDESDKTLGRRRWAIPEGYIPGTSVASNDPAPLSHEVACLLNPTDQDAENPHHHLL